MRWRRTSGARSRMSSRGDVATAAEQREHARGPHQPDRAARARAELDQGREVGEPMRGGVARRGRERDGVADDLAVDEHVRDGFGVTLEVGKRQALAHGRRGEQAAPDDRGLLSGGRVVDDDLHQEAVELGLGQSVGAL